MLLRHLTFNNFLVPNNMCLDSLTIDSDVSGDKFMKKTLKMGAILDEI